MSYMVSASQASSGVLSSARTAGLAMEWIRDHRALGAHKFCIVNSRQHQISERELEELARQEDAELEGWLSQPSDAA